MSVPKAGSEQFIVRMPEGMRARIAVMAKANLRSMNSEIVYLLQQAVREQAKDPENKSAPESAPTLARA